MANVNANKIERPLGMAAAQDTAAYSVDSLLPMRDPNIGEDQELCHHMNANPAQIQVRHGELL